MDGDFDKKRSTSILGLLAKEGIDRLLSLAQLLTIISGSMVALYFHFKPTTDQILTQKLGIINQAQSDLASASGLDRRDIVTFLLINNIGLNGQSLSHYDLSSISAQNADFSYSTIASSNFSNADLRNDKFYGASVSDTDFAYTNLSGAAFDDLFYKRSKWGNQFTNAILPVDFKFGYLSNLACTRQAPSKTENIWSEGENLSPGQKPKNQFIIMPFAMYGPLNQNQIRQCNPKNMLPPDACQSPWCSNESNPKSQKLALMVLCCGATGILAQLIRLALQKQKHENADQIISFTYQLAFGFIAGLCLSPLILWQLNFNTTTASVPISIQQFFPALFATYFVADVGDGLIQRIFLKNSETSTP